MDRDLSQVCNLATSVRSGRLRLSSVPARQSKDGCVASPSGAWLFLSGEAEVDFFLFCHPVACKWLVFTLARKGKS